MSNASIGREQDAPYHGVNPADLRAAPRHALLIRAAKLVVDSAEYLVVLRDASDTGVSLQLFHEMPAAGVMLLELQNEARHEVERVWLREGRMGMRFLQPIDVEQLIEMPAQFEKRPIRVRVAAPGSIGTLADNALCTIRDLSQHGAKVVCGKSFAIDQRVRLRATDMPTVPAKIRWRKGDMMGLAFETTFQLSELANIVDRFNTAAIDLQMPARSAAMP